MSALQILLGAATFAATLRMAVPLLYVSLGGLLTKQAGIENIGLEGLMLVERAVNAVKAFGNTPATPDEAREILKLGR